MTWNNKYALMRIICFQTRNVQNSSYPKLPCNYLFATRMCTGGDFLLSSRVGAGCPHLFSGDVVVL